MRIGIDIDDTICRTTEKVNEYMNLYAKDENIDPLMIMNYEDVKDMFFEAYLENIYTSVVVKRNAKEVLRRLRKKGNKLFIITARNNRMCSKITDIEELTRKWLSDNEIEVDGIFIDCYGEKRADVCREQKIDVMIDDDPYNYKMISSNKCKCLLFDDRERFNLKDDYVTNWLEVEDYIEKLRREG